MDFLQRNLFAQLRTDNFGTKEELEPMTVFKKKKIAQMMKNLNAYDCLQKKEDSPDDEESQCRSCRSCIDEQ